MRAWISSLNRAAIAVFTIATFTEGLRHAHSSEVSHDPGHITRSLKELQSYTDTKGIDLARTGAVARSDSEGSRLNQETELRLPQLVVQRGHNYLVLNAIFSRDGAMIASSDTSGTVILWDTRTGLMLRTFIGHVHSVRKLAFSSDGSMLATSGDDQTVRVWNTRNGSVLQVLQLLCADITFRDDSGSMMCSNSDGIVSEWNPLSATHVRSFRAAVTAKALTFHWNDALPTPYYPGGSTVSFALNGETVHKDFLSVLFDPNTNRRAIPPSSHIDERVAFGPMGSLVASVVQTNELSGKLRIWDLVSGMTFAHFSAYASGGIENAVFSPNGEYVATSQLNTLLPRGQHRKIRVWRADTGDLVQEIDGDQLFRFSPDNKKLLGTIGSDKLTVWDVTSGRALHSISPSNDVANSLAFSTDSKLLAWAGLEGTIHIWDMRAGRLLHSLVGHPGTIARIDISPNGDRVVAGSLFQGFISMWDVQSGSLLWAFIPDSTLGNKSPKSGDVGFSPDGKYIFYHDGSRYVSRESESGELSPAMDTLFDSAIRAVLSQDGKHLSLLREENSAGSSESHETTGKPMYVLSVADASGGNARILDRFDYQTPGRYVEDLRFDRSGEKIAVQEVQIDKEFRSTRTIDVWDVTGQEPPVKVDAQIIRSFTFTADGQTLICGLMNGDISAIELTSGSTHILISGLSSKVIANTLAASGNGELVAAGGDDTVVRLWSLGHESHVLRLFDH